MIFSLNMELIHMLQVCLSDSYLPGVTGGGGGGGLTGTGGPGTVWFCTAEEAHGISDSIQSQALVCTSQTP